MSINAMHSAQPDDEENQSSSPQQKQESAQVIPLRPPSRWHDPLQLIQNEAPSHVGRIVLWSVAVLFLILLVWAIFGKLDIIATAEGKLATQTLVKIVQPAEPGVIKELLVEEGDIVKEGQVLAKLDTTLATADKNVIHSELAIQQMQERRIEAELSNQPMLPKAGDDPELYAQVHGQYTAHRRAFLDGMEQERSLLAKAEHEKRSALQILAKLEQTLPTYRQSAEAYAKLQKDGFVSGLAAAEKQREAVEKAKDLDAQHSIVASLDATIFAQSKKVSQLQSVYKSELETELADIRAKIKQLQPSLDKSIYR
jgi:hemolysin D